MTTKERLMELNNSDDVTLDVHINHKGLVLDSTITGKLSVRNNCCRLESETGDYINFNAKSVTNVKSFGDSGIVTIRTEL